MAASAKTKRTKSSKAKDECPNDTFQCENCGKEFWMSKGLSAKLSKLPFAFGIYCPDCKKLLVDTT